MADVAETLPIQPRTRVRAASILAQAADAGPTGASHETALVTKTEAALLGRPSFMPNRGRRMQFYGQLDRKNGLSIVSRAFFNQFVRGEWLPGEPVSCGLVLE